MCVCVYIYIYIYISSGAALSPGGTANLRTKILDFRGFDSSRILILRGGIPRPIGISPEIVSQAILVGMILVVRLGVGIGRGSCRRSVRSNYYDNYNNNNNYYYYYYYYCYYYYYYHYYYYQYYYYYSYY